MFHPLYNYNGKLSIFRLCCLILFFICVILYFFTDKEPNTTIQPKSDNTVQGVDNQTLEQNRASALSEIEEGLSFLSTCGNINEGYIGCSWQFSDFFNKNYDYKLEAQDDGFVLKVKAKASQKGDNLCQSFSFDSLGVYKAYDNLGHESDKCIPDNFMKKYMSANIHRMIDYLPGRPAISGLSLAQ